jgi:cell division protein FtsN
MPLLIVFSLLPYHSRVTDTLTSSPASMIPEASLFRLNYPDVLKRDTAKTIIFPMEENVKRDSVKRDLVTSEDVKGVKEVTGVKESKEVRSEDVKTEVGKFPVIAGCFKVKSNADRLHKQLVEKGYPASIVVSRTGLNKVIMQSFATRREAVDGLERLKKAEPGLQLWVAL